MLADDFWSDLRQRAEHLRGTRLSELVRAEADRAATMSFRVGGLQVCFARQHLDAATHQWLNDAVGPAGLAGAMRAMFDGAIVNSSEQRPALHTALRSCLGQSDVARAASAEAQAALVRMAAMVDELERSGITDIVNVGIGGSDLGPRLVVDALRDHSSGRFTLHFLNNADASAVQHLLPRLDPERTAVILVSKSFGTQETLLNGRILIDWLRGRGRLYAVSANVAAAEAFGVPAARVLPMWDWVGGRYSLWSAVGFAIALAVGMPAFRRLLAGAALMDAHVLAAPVESNLALQHALFVLWNRNGMGLSTHAVLPYDLRLALLPDYLQQLVMESLGKSVRSDGSEVRVATVPLLWGGTGTSAQHSFFQALHQGAEAVPADFVGVIQPDHAYPGSHSVQLANLLAQAEALANGHFDADPQHRHPGGRPSTMILLDALTPETLGALLAMYEHSVYALSVLWGINAFDQWGVEHGKQLAARLLPAIEGDAAVADPVSRALVEQIRGLREAC